MKNMKKLLIYFLSIFLISFKSYSLIEVDITRENLNPLPLAVSPLSIDNNSKKNFKRILDKENIGFLFEISYGLYLLDSKEDRVKAKILLSKVIEAEPKNHLDELYIEKAKNLIKEL